MITCPLCNKDDRIQKVSAIYSSGVSRSEYGGPSSTLVFSGDNVGVAGTITSGSVTTASQLALKLAPPRKPEYPGTDPVLIIGIFMLILAICITFMLGIPGVFKEGWVILVGSYLFGFLFVWLGNKNSKANKASYTEKLTTWEKQNQLWNKVYYCFRDDVVFDPETGEAWHFKN